MAASPPLTAMHGAGSLRRCAWALLLLSMAAAGSVEAAQCGSAVLFEVDAPTVFDELDPVAPSSIRFWEAGSAGTNRSESGCQIGCIAASGSVCAGGGDCLALAGISWLNASCAVAGTLPTRTVFLVEQTTTDSGGRWAAINLDHNGDDANTDLDAKAAVVCGGCASTLSPYLGGDGRPTITASSVVEGELAVDLAWTTPPAAAQALSNGTDLVTGYGILYRTYSGSPAPTTGDTSGWVLVSDQDADGTVMNGYSVDTSASVQIPLTDLSDFVSFAIGLNFDGGGDPVADANTRVSAYISDDTDSLPVPTACGEPNDLVLGEQTISDVQEFVACRTITAGNGFAVSSTGEVTLRAGESIGLQNGFSVASGASFTVRLDPSLSP